MTAGCQHALLQFITSHNHQLIFFFTLCIRPEFPSCLPCPPNAQQSHWIILGCALAVWPLLGQTSQSTTSILVISIPLGTPRILHFQAREQRLGWLHHMGGFIWGWDLFRISREIPVVSSRLVFLWWLAPRRITGWGLFSCDVWGSECSTERAAMDSCQGRPVEVHGFVFQAFFGDRVRDRPKHQQP